MKKLIKRCKKRLTKLINKSSRKKLISSAIILSLLSIGLDKAASYKSDQYIFDRVVQIVVEGVGSCSGEQVHAPSGKDYVLTAAHCRELVEAGATIITDGGDGYPAKFIAEDIHSDLLLLEGIPGLRGLDIAKSSEDRQEVRTYTHGSALKAYRTEGVIIENMKISVMLYVITSQEEFEKCSMPKHAMALYYFLPACFMEVEETISTAFTSPGSSGGAVVDSNGDLMGVVSAGGGGYSLFVRLIDIHNFIMQF